MSGANDQIDQLITSVNDAAAHARTLVAGLLSVALIMSVMVIGTTDEAMFRNAINIAPELGVQISVSIAHLFAPIILVFLHIGALIHLDILDARRIDFQALLGNADPSAAKHHRLRIDGMVEAYAFAPDALDANPSALRRAIAWLTIVWMPLIVLLALQISFARFQSWPITLVQAAMLLVDACALLRFFARQRYRRGETLRCNWRITTMTVVLFLGWINAHPPYDDDMALNVRWIESSAYSRYFQQDSTPHQWEDAFPDGSCSVGHRDEDGVAIVPSGWDVFFWPVLRGCNLLDILACPYTGWGCRYLDLSNRTQIAGDASGDLIDAVAANSLPFVSTPNPNPNPTSEAGRKCGALNLSDPPLELAPPPEAADAHTRKPTRRDEFHIGMQGLKLRGRNLRFASMKDSMLIGADLINTNLHGANLEESYLVGAWLHGANLSEAQLDDAVLEGAMLDGTNLRGASLREAHLQRATLLGADLSCARPDSLDKTCTGLNGADLTGARLTGADLTGAELRRVGLIDVDLRGATMTSADLGCSILMDVDLSGASLHMAELANSTWKTVKLHGVWFTGADVTGATVENLDLEPAAVGYLLATADEPPSEALKLFGSVATMAPRDPEGIAQGLAEVACEKPEIGGGMVRWVTAAQKEYTDGPKSEITAAIRKAFDAAIIEHHENVKAKKDYRCSGLADLYLTPDQRAALGFSSTAD